MPACFADWKIESIVSRRNCIPEVNTAISSHFPGRLVKAIKGTWRRTESNREAKYYEITKVGQKALKQETQGWRRMSALVERLLLEES